MKSLMVRAQQHSPRVMLAAAGRGETIVVRKRNRPLARIVPTQTEAQPWPDLGARPEAIHGGADVSSTADPMEPRGQSAEARRHPGTC
jgi:antitoxin (DNA-binding transcriptional repressor) of toxin-antitoxin stability system